MEKNRSTKIVAIAALFIAVIGLSIGFAAFSSTLTIQSDATVTPDSSDWDVHFKPAGTITPAGSTWDGTAYTAAQTFNTTVGSGTPAITGFGAAPATLTKTSNQVSSVTGIHAYFTAPGQQVTYSFQVENTGNYDGYLRTVTFKNATGGESPKVCTPGAGTSLNPSNEATDACAGISYSVTIGSTTYAYDGGVSGVHTVTGNSQMVARTNGTTNVVVTITYANGATRADGPFEVTFGDIELVYSSVAG